ncbi:MAG TPA: S1 RNA-binding domain-containing protein [Anaerolineales bacterium]|nr:S1 RNA-binding domain-containing protein [Anaerolineales bacterium]
MLIEQNEGASGPEMQPVGEAIVPEMQPVDEAMAPEMQPVDEAIVPEAQPVDEAMAPEMQPVGEVIGPEMQPVDEAMAPGMQPVDEALAPEAHPMDAFLEEKAMGMDTPRRGEIRTGTIARITETDVLVDIGAKSEGVIPVRELEQLPTSEREALGVGKQVTVYVIRSSGSDDMILLSLARAEEEKDWHDAEALLTSKEIFEGVVSGYNKGGVIVKLGRLRGFIPASQVSLSRRRRAEGESPDKRWGKMVGEPIVAKVIEVDRRRNRLILSERAASREAREVLKQRLIAELKPGEVRSGHVISLADFGAFVDIGGADGLVHMSEISWKRISHPRDALKVGQEVQVKVLGVDPDLKRISLSMRELEADPWETLVGQLQEGQLVEGKITKLTKFGAFASLAGMEDYEVEGLVHISELSDRHVNHPKEVVQEGQTLALRVIKIDRKRRRIGLSMKRVDSAEYAELDWRTAMGEIQGVEEEEAFIPAASEIVEDFDEALEEEQLGMGPLDAEAPPSATDSTSVPPTTEKSSDNHQDAPQEWSDPGGGAEEA